MCEVFEFIVTCLHRNYWKLIETCDSFSNTIKMSVQVHAKGTTTQTTLCTDSDRKLADSFS